MLTWTKNNPDVFCSMKKAARVDSWLLGSVRARMGYHGEVSHSHSCFPVTLSDTCFNSLEAEGMLWCPNSSQ